VRTAYYPGGHASYTVENALRQLSEDLRRLIAGK
jgi:hypothetical protein